MTDALPSATNGSIHRLSPLTMEEIAAVHEKITLALTETDVEMLDASSIEGKLRISRGRHAGNGGIVYFIQCQEFLKIGWTSRDDAMHRAKQISPMNPHQLLILQTTPGPRALEREFHRALRHLHHRGEWFHFNDEFESALSVLD